MIRGLRIVPILFWAFAGFVFFIATGTQAQVLPAQPQRGAAAQKQGAVDLPTQEQIHGLVDPNAYIIGAEDQLSIQVRGQNMGTNVRVRPDGMITLPTTGEEMKVIGMTVNQLTASLTKKFSEWVVNPIVIVNVTAPMSQTYKITGRFNKAGTVIMLKPTTVVDAIIDGGGGFQEFANEKRVIIMRGKERIEFNYKDYMKGKNQEKNILLKPGDIVMVN